MSGRLTDVVSRWRGLVALCVVLTMGAALVFSSLSPKHWETTATIRLDPFPVPALYPPDLRGSPTPEQAIDAEVALAGGYVFRDALTTQLDRTVDYRVDGNADGATLEFTARGDSAEEASRLATHVGVAYFHMGSEPRHARREANLLRAELDRSGDPSTPRLEELDRTLAQLDADGGELVEQAPIPDDPIAPHLARRLVAAGLLGLALGMAVAWLVDQRRPRLAPVDRAPRREPPDGLARLGGGSRALLGALVVLMVVPVVAAGLAGVVTVWEMRPTTNPREEALYACLERWLAATPEDATVVIDPESDVFFRNHYEEFAFGRVTLADPTHPPDVVLRIEPGPGPEECDNYSLRRERL